jgi:hypothetical protein
VAQRPHNRNLCRTATTFRTPKIERVQGYAILTLNRPEAMNALSRELLGEMRSALLDLEQDLPVLRHHLSAAKLRYRLIPITRMTRLRSAVRVGEAEFLGCGGGSTDWIMLIGRTPPATITCAAMCTACCGEPHCRSMVTPGTVCGSPAADQRFQHVRTEVSRMDTTQSTATFSGWGTLHSRDAYFTYSIW